MYMTGLHSLKRTIRPWYHGAVSYVGAVRYGFPSTHMRVVGVTGTKGKSTVIQMLVSVARAAGWTVGYSSSIGFSDGKTDQENTLRNSMPGRFRLHQLMAEAKHNGADLFVVESTSEGLAQNRHRGIQYDIGVFTNLYPEHIQSHGSFEAYQKAKSLLFTAVGKNAEKRIGSEVLTSCNILNGESTYASYYASCSDIPATYVGLKENGTWDVTGHILSQQQENIVFEVNVSNADTHRVTLPLSGTFNVINALLTAGVADRLGIHMNQVVRGLESVSTVPGRMEIVSYQPRIIVDYAHIPEALDAVYTEIHERWKTNENRIIAVLGACGGGRDTWKRSPMGEVAGAYADYVIVTNEDPYDEDPQNIIDEVFAGVMKTEHQENETAFRIRSRKAALQKALELGEKDDIIIITGKGSETSIIENGEKLPWNDKKEVQTLLQEA